MNSRGSEDVVTEKIGTAPLLKDHNHGARVEEWHSSRMNPSDEGHYAEVTSGGFAASRTTWSPSSGHYETLLSGTGPRRFPTRFANEDSRESLYENQEEAVGNVLLDRTMSTKTTGGGLMSTSGSRSQGESSRLLLDGSEVRQYDMPHVGKIGQEPVIEKQAASRNLVDTNFPGGRIQIAQSSNMTHGARPKDLPIITVTNPPVDSTFNGAGALSASETDTTYGTRATSSLGSPAPVRQREAASVDGSSTRQQTENQVGQLSQRHGFGANHSGGGHHHHQFHHADMKVISERDEEEIFETMSGGSRRWLGRSCCSGMGRIYPCCYWILVILICFLICLACFFFFVMPRVRSEIRMSLNETTCSSNCPTAGSLEGGVTLDDVWREIKLLKDWSTRHETNARYWTEQALSSQYLNLTRQMNARISALDNKLMVRMTDMNQTLTGMITSTRNSLKTEQMNIKYSLQDELRVLDSKIKGLELSIKLLEQSGPGQMDSSGSWNVISTKITDILVRLAQLESEGTSGLDQTTIEEFKKKLRIHITESELHFARVDQDLKDLYGKHGGGVSTKNRTVLIKGNYYFFSMNQANQAGALKYCREMTGTLLTIGNSYKLQDVSKRDTKHLPNTHLKHISPLMI